MNRMLRRLCLGILLGGIAAQAQDSALAPIPAPAQVQSPAPLPAPAPAPVIAQAPAPRPVARYEMERPSRYRLATRERYSDYVGFGAGMSTGIGISWRHWFQNGWGVQANLLPYYREETYPNDDGYEYPTRDSGYQHEGFLSAGVTVLKTLAEADFLRMLGYTSLSVTEEYTKNDYYTSSYSMSWEPGASGNYAVRNQSVEEKRKYALGAGLGLEFYVWRFAFTGMLGYRGEYDQITKEKQLGPSVEAGAHFRF